MEFVVKFVSKQVRNFLYFPARSGSDFLAPHPPTAHLPWRHTVLSRAEACPDRAFLPQGHLTGFWQASGRHLFCTSFFLQCMGNKKGAGHKALPASFGNKPLARAPCKKRGQESGSVHFPCALHKTLSNSERSERSRVLGPAVSPRVRHPGQLSRAGLSTQRSPLRDSTQPVTVTISARFRLSMRCFSLSLRATRKTSRAI